MVQVSVAESYTRLGLSAGASLDEVKSAYRKSALRYHPDKNPGDPTATQKFQSLSEAYNILLKHLDHSSQPPPRASGFGGSPFPFEFRSPFGGFDHHHHHHHHHDDDYGSSEYDYYDDYSDDEFEDVELDEFYRFLYEELLRGRASRYAGRQFHSMHPNMGHARYEHETDEERLERLRRAREKHDADARRAEQEAANRKIREQAARQHEMDAASERRKSKAKSKKAEKADAQANVAASKASAASRAQQLRSETFAAARAGDTTRVKKGVWENNVDAAGPERIGAKAGETLLHIAASRGDLALVEWLDSHNAEAEDRDAMEYTAFHLALEKGIVPVVDYFLGAHDPEDSPGAYLPAPRDTSLLAMAIPDSQLVWAILESGLVGKGKEKDVEAAKQACGEPGCTSEIRTMLAEWAGFSLGDLSDNDEPPPSPNTTSDEGETYQTPETSIEPDSPILTRPTTLQGKANGGDRRPPPQPASPTPSPTAAATAAAASGSTSSHGGNTRGRGGRGRGRSRGRGAPRGRGQ